MQIDFINETTENIAKQLLWKLLVYKKNWVVYSWYIVETEAYLWDRDMACHSYNFKRTPKNEAMYLSWWHIYIYTIHTHKMLNIVSKEKDIPEAVLVRAIEPVEWIKYMEKNRKNSTNNLTNWPWKLTRAFEIGDELNEKLLIPISEDNSQQSWQGNLFIDYENSKIPRNIESSTRIWIPNKWKWTNKKLRYFVKWNIFVSGIKKANIEKDNWWN
jgi:DNA-3-methyladenine glycosylase